MAARDNPINHPIPDDALDDRLGFIGVSGSGKSYNAGGAVERLLSQQARVVIVDPLGVWWGLRLLADGNTPSPYNVAIFGGAHGDLPLNEYAGALIGETAGMMAESCIVDLSELRGKAAERRFMTAFLDAIYLKTTTEPFHLIVDEADLFAPQKPAKGAETLLGHMEDIVRRGRIKGFIPWLISQRPAVINKNVLSQVDGLIAFRLTATQDRDALDDWIEGQADRAQGRAIKDSLPTLQTGQGVVWLPGRGILTTATFPPKATYDSSRTPKRGEKIKPAASLKPLDLTALREKLSAVGAETKANDPKTLRARIAELERELKAKPAADPVKVDQAWTEGYAQGEAETTARHAERIQEMQAAIDAALGCFAPFIKRKGEEVPVIDVRWPAKQRPPRAPSQVRIAPPPRADDAAPLQVTGAWQRILDALAWLAGRRPAPSSKVQLAFISGYSPSSSGFANYLGAMRSAGLIEYPASGKVVLTAEGAQQARPPERALDTATLHAALREKLGAAKWSVLAAAIDAYPGAIDREAVAAASGYSPSSSGFANYLGELRSLGLIDYPGRGMVRAEDILFIGGARH